MVARHLKAAGLRVVVAFAGDPARLPDDASAAHAAWHAHGGSTTPTCRPRRRGWSLVVDALFGIGLQRPSTAATPTGSPPSTPSPARAWPSTSPAASTPTPAGASAPASRPPTRSASSPSPGLLTSTARTSAASCTCARSTWTPKPRAGAGPRDHPGPVRRLLAPCARNSHKGSYGDAALIGGAPGMVGAAILAGRAAATWAPAGCWSACSTRAALPVDILRPS